MRIIRKCCVAASILASMWALNNVIFKRFKSKSKSTLGEKFFSWRYGDIRYIKIGSGKPMLLLHSPGIGAGLHEWEQVIAPFAKSHTVYAIDLLGFGGSDKPAISYSAYMYTQLIIDFVNKIIKEPVHVCASFQSADFAVICSAFNKNLFTKMVLVNPTGVGNTVNTPTRKYCALRSIIELPILGTSIYCAITSRLRLKHLLKGNCEGVTKQLVDRHYEAAHVGGANSKYAVAAYLSKAFNTDIYSKLCSVDIPVKIILSGDTGSVWRYKDISAQNKNVKIKIFEDGKRFPHRESPKLFFKNI